MQEDQGTASEENTQVSGDGGKGTQLVIIAIVILALVGGGLYFLSQRKNQSPEPIVTNPVESPIESPTATASSVATGKTKLVQITAKEYSFLPSKVTVNKGDHVKLTLKNSGSFPHNLVIDELGVSTKTIASGQSDTVEFTPTDAGSFTYVCSVPGHKDKGMVGTLTVK